MATSRLTPDMMSLIAERFRVLGEPARLMLMNELRAGEKTVGELVDATGLATGNVSKHLQLLYTTGFVTRRKESQFVYYGLAGDDVFSLCDIMCGRIETETESRRRAFARRTR